MKMQKLLLLAIVSTQAFNATRDLSPAVVELSSRRISAGAAGEESNAYATIYNTRKDATTGHALGPNASQRFGILHDPSEVRAWNNVTNAGQMLFLKPNRGFKTGNKDSELFGSVGQSLAERWGNSAINSSTPISWVMPSYAAATFEHGGDASKAIVKVSGRGKIKFNAVNLANFYGSDSRGVNASMDQHGTWSEATPTELADFSWGTNNAPYTTSDGHVNFEAGQINKVLGKQAYCKSQKDSPNQYVKFDTGVGVSDTQYVPYKYLHELSIDELDARFNNGLRKSSASDTLFGRNLSALLVAAASGPLTTDAYYSDSTTTLVTNQFNINDQVRSNLLSLLERWNVINQNYDIDSSNLPLKKESVAAVKNIPAALEPYSSKLSSLIDESETMSVDSSNIGIVREVIPWANVNGQLIERLDDKVYLPNKMLDKINFDTVLATLTNERLDGILASVESPIIQGSSMLSEWNDFISDASTLAQYSTTELLKTELKSRLDDLSEEESEGVKGIALRFMLEKLRLYSAYKPYNPALAAPLDPDIKRAVALVLEARSDLAMIDPATTWNNDIYNKARDELKATELAICLPGKAMLTPGSNDGLTLRHANGSPVYEVDWETVCNNSIFKFLLDNAPVPTQAQKIVTLQLVDTLRLLGDDLYTWIESQKQSWGMIGKELVREIDGKKQLGKDMFELYQNALTHTYDRVKSRLKDYLLNNATPAASGLPVRKNVVEYAFNQLRYSYDTVQARFHRLYGSGGMPTTTKTIIYTTGDNPNAKTPVLFADLFNYGMYTLPTTGQQTLRPIVLAHKDYAPTALNNIPVSYVPFAIIPSILRKSGASEDNGDYLPTHNQFQRITGLTTKTQVQVLGDHGSSYWLQDFKDEFMHDIDQVNGEFDRNYHELSFIAPTVPIVLDDMSGYVEYIIFNQAFFQDI